MSLRKRRRGSLWGFRKMEIMAKDKREKERGEREGNLGVKFLATKEGFWCVCVFVRV